MFDYEFSVKPGSVQQTKPGVCFPMSAAGGAVVALADGGKRHKQHTIQIKGQQFVPDYLKVEEGSFI